MNTHAQPNQDELRKQIRRMEAAVLYAPKDNATKQALKRLKAALNAG